MKILMTMVMLIFFSMASRAQNWAEFFKQKQTQEKYLLEQIVAYQVYLGYAKKGYNIAKDGTKLVGDIKNGDFNLHNNYFNSLKVVNPQIRDASQSKDINAMYTAMLKGREATLKLVVSSKVFSPDEVAAIKALYLSLTKDAQQYLQDFKLLTDDGRLELSDDQRIFRIENLNKGMQEKYGFQLQTDHKIKALAESRIAERKSVETLKKLYGF